jgi:hypothetical protein
MSAARTNEISLVSTTPSLRSPHIVLPLRLIPPVVSITLFLCLLLTIILFFITAPVPDHLPALSEAALYSPGKYLFSLSIILCGVLIFILGPVLYYSLLQKVRYLEFIIQLKNQSLTNAGSQIICCGGCFRLRWLNVASCLLIIIASFGLTGLGLVPLVEGDANQANNINHNTQGATVFHLLCTAVFFISIFTHMCLGSISSFWMDRQLKILGKVPSNSRIWNRIGVSLWTVLRLICTVLVAGDLIIFQALVTIIVMNKCSVQEIESGSCAAIQFSEKFLGAASQYVIVALIILYLTSYMNEMKGLCIVLLKKSDSRAGIAINESPNSLHSARENEDEFVVDEVDLSDAQEL